MTERGGVLDGGHADDLLPLLALGVADDDDLAQAAAHTQSCEQCRTELAQFREDADRLREGGALMRPPASLWERIEGRLAEGQPTAAVASPAGRSWPLRQVLAMAAALALVAVLSVSLTLALDDRGASTPASNLDDIPTNDVVFTLAPVDSTVGAAGRIFMSESRTEGVVAVSGLVPLPEHQRYAVWILRDDNTRLSAGTFSVDKSGNAVSALSLPQLPYDWQHSGRYVALSISRVEVAEASTPVGGPVLVGPLY